MSAPAIPVAEFPRPLASAEALSVLDLVTGAMKALASLKLTVALFAAGIFIVYVGTVAQQEADIWQVVRDYFHAWIMWVDVNLLFPRAFFGFMPHIPLPRFPAPGGLTIGTLMAVNLLAAHGWRFTIQAKGLRLALGVLVTLIGLAIGFVIIWAGHNAQGFQAKPPFSWDLFWTAFLLASTLLLVASLIAYVYFGVAATLLRLQQASVPWVEIILLALIGLTYIPVGLLLIWGFRADPRPSDEALRIVWQLVQGGLAGLVLLAGCILIFKKRGGMVVLHLGIGLLFFNELFVALTARERQIFMQEGQVVNYSRDIRSVELVLVDPSGDKSDEHIVVPQSRLVENFDHNLRLRANLWEQPDVEAEANRLMQASGATFDVQRKDRPKYMEVMDQALRTKGKPQEIKAEYIDDAALPVKIAVLAYYKNADVRDLKPEEKTLADKGRGLKEAIVALPIAKGTDGDSGVDMAAAYVRLADKSGKDLGTYLLSQLASEQKRPERFAEKLDVGGKKYDLYLRFKREYMPFTMSLVDVRKDDYVASDTPRNYSSDVRINDAVAGVDQAVHIKMNDPLRYRNDTFYQSGYQVVPGGEATTLQVVHNRAWMIPYVACMVVVLGMIAHFLITVTRFISRREAEEIAAGDVIVAQVAGEQPQAAQRSKRKAQKDAAGFNWSLIGLPALAAGVMLAWMASALRPARSPEKELDLVRFGRLPVAHEGRVKPLDTLARNMLRAMSLRESVKLEKGGKLSATQWLLEVIAGNEESVETYRIFRIDNPDVLKVFGLAPRSGFLYNIAEIRGGMNTFLPQVQAAGKTPKDQRTLEQAKLLELHERLTAYMLLAESFAPPRGLPRLPTAAELQADESSATRYLQEFGQAVRISAEQLSQAKAPRPIPVATPPSEAPNDAWQLYPVAWGLAYIQQNVEQGEPDPAMISFDGMKRAYRDKKAEAFNNELTAYEAHLARTQPALYTPRKAHLESYFNHTSPFYAGIQFYVLAFVLGILGWLFRYRPLNWAAFTVLALTFAFHTAALVLRIYISGRPPVTNLYSSAIFIGWAVVFAALVVEAIFRLGLGNIAGSIAGFATLLISYFLAAGGDTITVLQAVLDTQFWLATHVVCITLGYAATYFAGLFGVLYVVFGLATPLLTKDTRKDLGRMIYGITCFAILFSFFGTVLGGLWADDSWGRFWGWDPKENGALLIVLWNALILHARWDKMVGDRGLAVLAIGGNIATSWSWFGVNFLGIGLHAYGAFEGSPEFFLMGFIASQLTLIALGCLPTEWWWSFQADSQQRSPSLKPAA